MTGLGTSPEVVAVPGPGAADPARPVAALPPAPVAADAAAPVAADLCDSLLDELGRRGHTFGWLRVPETGEPLAVDAYYPANRVVLVSGLDDERDQLCRELVPRHGLCLIIAPAQLRGEPSRQLAGLRRALERGGWSPPEDGELEDDELDYDPEVGDDAGDQAAAARAAALADLMAIGTVQVSRDGRASTATIRRGNAPRGVWASLRGLVLALLLIAAVMGEAYLGVVRLAIHDGYVVLGCGVVLDGWARLLGAGAASHGGRHWIALGCLIAGSPGVAVAALLPARGRGTREPAALAGLIALLAVGAIVAGLMLRRH
jgi:hypothetical protein